MALRGEISGAGMMDCKRALDGDRRRPRGRNGPAASQGRGRRRQASSATNDGTVDSYIHAGGKIGVLVEVGVETDFVSRSEPFKEFTHDLAMQVAAASPLWVTRDEVPEESSHASRPSTASPSRSKAKVRENVVEKIHRQASRKFCARSTRSSS